MTSATIILPTYNRAHFLPQAFASITSQQYTDWELIVVDDGSTDDTIPRLRELSSSIEQTVTVVSQPNAGHAAARNTGIEHAKGQYVAFHDTDDSWLPHHLKDCISALEDCSDVDWAYGASRIIDESSNSVLADSSFREGGRLRPFMELGHEKRGSLHIIRDQRATECAIAHGLYCGLQNSVIRRTCFDRFRLIPGSMADDQVATIEALKNGFTLAYFDEIHVDYRVHGGNVSAASGDLDKRIGVLNKVAHDLEGVMSRVTCTRSEHRAFRMRLNQEYFWKLGYATLWMSGDRTEALRMFRRGLQHWPWDWRCWKTFLVKRFLARSS